MPWLDFDGLGGLQPKLCLEKLRLHSRMWNGLAWPSLWGFKPNQTTLPLLACCLWFLWKCQGPTRSVCRGLGVRAVTDVTVVAVLWQQCPIQPLITVRAVLGSSQGVTDCFTSFPCVVSLCSPPRSQTPQDSHRALEIESHSSGEKNSFQVRSSPPSDCLCFWGMTGEAAEAETSTPHSNPGRSRLVCS